MITFTQSDLKTELLRRDPTLNDLDSTKLDNKIAVGQKVALSQNQANYMQTNDSFGKSNTLGGTAPTTGSTPTISTTAYDVFQIAIISGAIKVADNSIWVEIQSTGTFLEVTRIEIDNYVVTGGSATVYGFYETNGFINLVVKDATFTPPARVHYNYWRGLTPTASTSDPLDIKPQDFSTFCDAVQAVIATQ
jgi:hypothetical protein